jgi:hypothetical protein
MAATSEGLGRRGARVAGRLPKQYRMREPQPDTSTTPAPAA